MHFLLPTRATCPTYFTLLDSLTLIIFGAIKNTNLFYVALQTNSGLGCLIVDVSRSNAGTHRVGLLWKSDQLVAADATYGTDNKHKRRTSMTSARFLPTSYTVSNTISLHSSLIVRTNSHTHPSKKNASSLQDLLAFLLQSVWIATILKHFLYYWLSSAAKLPVTSVPTWA